MRTPTFLSAVSLAFLMYSSPASGSDWPQWRGTARAGHVTGAAWPDSLDTNHPRQTWRVDLGPGYSGPIAADDHGLTTETRDKKFEIVRALDRKTGKELWQQELETKQAGTISGTAVSSCTCHHSPKTTRSNALFKV